MSFANALLYSLVGIATVFFALVLLMCIIKVLTAFGDRADRKAAAGAADMAPAQAIAADSVGASDMRSALVSGLVVDANRPAAPAGPPAPGSAGEVKLYDTPPRVAAMLMAIVADELKAPLNELRFISIREIKEEE